MLPVPRWTCNYTFAFASSTMSNKMKIQFSCLPQPFGFLTFYRTIPHFSLRKIIFPENKSVFFHFGLLLMSHFHRHLNIIENWKTNADLNSAFVCRTCSHYFLLFLLWEKSSIYDCEQYLRFRKWNTPSTADCRRTLLCYHSIGIEILFFFCSVSFSCLRAICWNETNPWTFSSVFVCRSKSIDRSGEKKNVHKLPESK